MKQKILNNKFLLIIFLLLTSYVVWSKTYSYNNNKAVKHLTEHALSKSHNCCAWYVMRATQAGGCPNIILPAWAYRYYLPFLGFKEINNLNYKPKLGDIVVFPQVKNHIWGHIAMWNGKQWISDFKQKNIIVSKDYSNYIIFRK